LPLVKPPWCRITAIVWNCGDHVWMVANCETPDFEDVVVAIGATGMPAELAALALP
jgi:hypothetical protein